MNIYYKTCTLDIENDNSLFDFVLNICKNHNLNVKGLPFVDEETSTSYNPATKTMNSSTTYTDSILITIYKSENGVDVPFSDKEVLFVENLIDYLMSDENSTSYESQIVKVEQEIQKLSKGHIVKRFENLGYALGTSIFSLFLTTATIFLVKDYNQTFSQYITEYISGGYMTSYGVDIVMGIVFFFILGTIGFLFPTEYTQENIEDFKDELEDLKQKKEFSLKYGD